MLPFRRAPLIVGSVSAVLVAGMSAAPPVAARITPLAVRYTFRTLDDSNDPTFNGPSDINKHGVIAGCYGGGDSRGHPNRGYLLEPPYHQSDYRPENYPGMVQTCVYGLNDNGISVGYASNENNPGRDYTFGFWERHGHFHKVVFPTHNNTTPPMNALVGVNDSGIAVGYYVNRHFYSRPYRYNVFTHQFSLPVAGPEYATPSGINNRGDIVGYFITKKGQDKCFIAMHTGHLIIIARRGASFTFCNGINDSGEVVGNYGIVTRSYGFTWTARGGFRTVSDPKGIGSTAITGVNDARDLVGVYTDKTGNTHGFLATPSG